MRPQGEFWVINSAERLSNFLRHVQDQWKEHKYLVAQVRHGQQRSLSQNALWAVWAREYIAPHMGWTEEQARLAMRHMFLGYDDIKINEKLTIEHQLRSTANLDFASMYQFMSDVQAFWARYPGRPLILESRGEFLEAQRKEVA